SQISWIGRWSVGGGTTMPFVFAMGQFLDLCMRLADPSASRGESDANEASGGSLSDWWIGRHGRIIGGGRVRIVRRGCLVRRNGMSGLVVVDVGADGVLDQCSDSQAHDEVTEHHGGRGAEEDRLDRVAGGGAKEARGGETRQSEA